MSSYFPIPNNFQICTRNDLSIESSITVFNYPNNSLLRNINKKRNKIYYFADFKIICESLKKHEIVDKILQKCKKNEIIC